jgi:hypothetical protein
MNYSFHEITITPAGVDPPIVMIERDQLATIVWQGKGVNLTEVNIDKTWPFDQPAPLKGRPNSFYVTYLNNAELGKPTTYPWTYNGISIADPPEIENSGSPFPGNKR